MWERYIKGFKLMDYYHKNFNFCSDSFLKYCIKNAKKAFLYPADITLHYWFKQIVIFELRINGFLKHYDWVFLNYLSCLIVFSTCNENSNAVRKMGKGSG